jgi:hypothetical protein
MTTTFYASTVLYVHPIARVNCAVASHFQSLESLEADIVMSRLRESGPKIWEFECASGIRDRYNDVICPHYEGV